MHLQRHILLTYPSLHVLLQSILESKRLPGLPVWAYSAGVTAVDPGMGQLWHQRLASVKRRRGKWNKRLHTNLFRYIFQFLHLWFAEACFEEDIQLGKPARCKRHTNRVFKQQQDINVFRFQNKIISHLALWVGLTWEEGSAQSETRENPLNHFSTYIL